MGLLDKLFVSKPTDFASPMQGEIITLNKVKDEVFSSKAVGDGFAIYPKDGKVYSPVDGVIEVLFPTFHAIGITAVDRNQYLVHIGLDSVKLNGQGFKSYIEQGSKVKQGDLLIEFDLDQMIKHEVDVTSPIIITNLNGRRFKLIKSGNVEAKEKGLFRINN